MATRVSPRVGRVQGAQRRRERVVLPAAEQTLARRIRNALDREDPVPLYHQLASVLRWEIGMGRAAIGQPLPPMRLLATALGVNYHTVRQAYGSLAEEGVVEPRRGAGTVVSATPKREYWRPPDASGEEHLDDKVYVVECNLTQAAALVEQVGRRYRVAAIPWLLEGWGEPPPGVVLGTTFHELQMRRQWAHRAENVHALELKLDTRAAEAVRRAAESLGLDRVLVVERDLTTGESIAEDVRRLLAPHALEVTVEVNEGGRAVATGAWLTVYAPRVWDRLPPEARLDPRAMPLAFPFQRRRLAAFANTIGWRTRPDG